MTPKADRTAAGQGNNLLANLHAADRSLITPFLSSFDAARNDILFECGQDVSTIFFPAGQTIVALVVPMDSDHAVEAATIGREGAAGGVISAGSLPAYTRAVVQNPGPCFSLPMTALQTAKAQSPTLRNLFSRYGDCLLSQVLQSVACNALHTIDQRCAKWLLSTRDRVGSDTLRLTHETLAEMLGVQRSYVSKVLGRFYRDKLVRIGRGRVEITDLAGLEQATCECYSRVTRHFERVLSGVYPGIETASRDGGNTLS